ncbi:MAG: uL15 family ribosomal protein, partial [Desulfurococcaceae archaeon]|nr:uL15 family ribosomal protein [Desulfurococcaceae archaeon]
TPRKTTAKVMTINLTQLNEIVTRTLQSGSAIVEEGKVVVNLAALGINKLLGEGNIEYPVKVLVQSCSKKAQEKIKKVGGIVQLVGSST